MGIYGVGGGVSYTPTKNIKPLSYNGIRSTGFRAVNVIQSDTIINRTVVVDQGGSSCHTHGTSSCDGGSSGGGFWSKLAGIFTGATSVLGLLNSIGLFDKKETTEDVAADTPAEQPAVTVQEQTEEPVKTLFGGMLEVVEVVGDKSKAKNGVKEFKTNISPDINEAANELKQMYTGIISDIKLEKQSDGTYKATVTIPDTLAHDGKTSRTVINNLSTGEELDASIMKIMDGLNNPFRTKQDE